MHRQDGSSAVELLGLLPLLLVVALLGWQLAIAAVAASDVETAARVASRAAAEGQDPRAAAAASLGGSDGLVVTRDGPDGVAVSVPVPIIPVVPIDVDLRITRSAAFPELD